MSFLENKPSYQREEWINASDFKVVRVDELQQRVVDRAKNTPLPVAIFDLDSTLYQVEDRNLAILKAWAHQNHSSPWSKAVKDLKTHHVGYSIEDTLKSIGVPSSEKSLYLEIKDFWRERFFTNEWLSHDQPYPCASSFVSELHKVGIALLYLTGRDEPGMGEQTRKSLQRDGFPFEGDSVFYGLKPKKELDDLEHKKIFLEQFGRTMNVIVSFENEPRNVALIQHYFPEAVHVFLKTKMSQRPAPVVKDVYLLENFE
ncbi:MAG: hypothetical protein CL678_07850 [Bdellovibrionaceae bacterium]|nr:hypothetical protein [Pseudobdellovibrionaceae bacterium]|tara:strand:- start:2202 stop:2975 length:774 start_codon:yes stop_codon:yes gene_type:complete